MKQLTLCVIVVIMGFSLPLRAGEGMWLPHLLAALNQTEMQSMGMKMTAEDIYSVNQGSLKDAIVHFGGFCTGEVISDQGLVLTNHHCGYGQIQSHSSLENNYLRDGFWAYSKEEELANPGLFVRFIDRIEDVTDAILDGVTDKMSTAERQSIIDQNIDHLKSTYRTGTFEEIQIRPFFKGNQYILFVTKDYTDIRLVGAPPESIGKYGHDTDNWVWPRHTGDFALFRIYSAPNGEPATYSEKNIPFQPKHALPISMDGVEEGDFTLVFGFPGRTNEYLPGAAVDITANQINPARIGIRESAMNVMDEHMKADEGIKIKYASKFARLTNYWKKWIGESQGLKRSKALAKKAELEAEYTKRLSEDNKLMKKYGDVLPTLNELYGKMAPYLVARSVQSEAFNRNVESISFGNTIQRLLNIYKNNGKEAYEEAMPRYKNFLEGRVKNYDQEVDLGVFEKLMNDYVKYMPTDFLPFGLSKQIAQYYTSISPEMKANSVSLNPQKMLELLDDPEALSKAFDADPIRRFVGKVTTNYDEMVEAEYNKLEAERADLMRKYMKAQMLVFTDKAMYPDANSTMRVTYGQVKGYEPKDGVYYLPQTYLEGVMEKYKPGDWEFDLPKKLIDLYDAKDYGPYAAENGQLPICFIGSNHTTGGNSGSPAIDAHGNLIGLNFDRVWEGTMSDLNYDASICRNIMVDARYIVFIIDKYAGAQNIVDELNLVNPKNK